MKYTDPGFQFRRNDLLLRPSGAQVLEWQEAPADASAVIPDEPTTEAPFVYSQGSFTLPLTGASVFSVLRSIYLLDGTQGLSRFFDENGLVPKQQRVGREFDTVEPEQFLLGDRLKFYRLLKIQLERLRQLRTESLGQMQERAVARARDRLTNSMEQIRGEALRYMRIENTPRSIDGALRAGYGGFPPGGDLLSVQVELVRLRDIALQTNEAARKYRQTLAPKLEHAMRPSFGHGEPGAWDVSVAEWESAEAALLERDPELSGLRNAELKARKRYLKAVADAAVLYPVIWRLLGFDRPDDGRELVKEIHGILGNAWRAANDLVSDLSSQPIVVWRFAPLMYDTMRSASVREPTITWRAVEERLEQELGPRLFSVLSMGSGLAGLGVIGLSALAGAALVAPPIVMGIGLADALFSVVDALQEYQEWRLRQSAFDACLDPALALTVEPSAAGAFFIVALDLLGAVTPVKVPKP